MQRGPVRVDPNTGKQRRTEWQAFTDKLWRYQWLSQRDEVLSEEIRNCWFELSQGVIDIVVKLFVLAQLRAISTGLERITVKLLRTIYEQELKPVHPMLDALRRGDPDAIVKYSDLQMPAIDKRLLELRKLIDERQEERESEDAFNGNEKAKKLSTFLQAMGCDSKLLQPLITSAFKKHPNLSLPDLVQIVLGWYSATVQPKTTKAEIVRLSDWHSLPSDDFRFRFSQAEKGCLYDELAAGKELFDVSGWLKSMG